MSYKKVVKKSYNQQLTVLLTLLLISPKEI